MKRILAILTMIAFMCAPAFGQTKLIQATMQSAAAGTGNGTSLNVSQVGAAGFQVTGTFVGTITFEGTIDGTNWVSVQVEDVAGGTVSTTATAAGIYVSRTAGILLVRARVSAYTSGSITVVGVGTNAPGALNVMGAGGDATAANQVLGNTSLSTIAGDTTSLDGKVTACNTGAVTVSAALPTGGNAIGKLATNTGVDIGDVTVATGEHNIVILTQAVGTPGTAEAFASTQQAIYFFIEARRVDDVNTSNVYVGTSAVDKDASQQIVMAPGDRWEWIAPPGVTADLDAFYIDAITATDGITGFYIAAP